jgi:hypothetical protein
MKKFAVEFETICMITIEVEASNEDEAKEKASEQVEVREYFSKSGDGTTLIIKGDNNKMFIDTDNMYDRISDINETE